MPVCLSRASRADTTERRQARGVGRLPSPSGARGSGRTPTPRGKRMDDSGLPCACPRTRCPWRPPRRISTLTLPDLAGLPTTRVPQAVSASADARQTPGGAPAAAAEHSPLPACASSASGGPPSPSPLTAVSRLLPTGQLDFCGRCPYNGQWVQKPAGFSVVVERLHP